LTTCKRCREVGDPKKKRNFFPVEKQFLVTRNGAFLRSEIRVVLVVHPHSCLYYAVPCTRRASELENYDPNSEFSVGEDGDDWVATHTDPNAGRDRIEQIPSIDDAGPSRGDMGDELIPDMSELEIKEEDDEVGQYRS
jgi:hypothetical protein